MKKTVAVVLGNQLFDDNPVLKKYPDAEVVMIEADNIFSKHNYHKHKLMLVMLAMRHYADFLKKTRRQVHYVEYSKGSHFVSELEKYIHKNKPAKLAWVRSADKTPNIVLEKIAEKYSIESEIIDTPQFLTPPEDLEKFFGQHQNPIMDNFYRWQRRRMGILMQDDKPTGGKWSFDSDNRKPLPKEITVPQLPVIDSDSLTGQVAKAINKNFASNPGSTDNFWLPTNRKQSLHWLDTFLKQRFSNFGDYEDAMRSGEVVLFHSALSPLMNLGLLTPAEVIKKASDYFEAGKTTLNNYEGFVRQIIGWREYMRAMYEFNESKIRQNFFGFKKKLEDYWYSGADADLPVPVKSVLKTTINYGYNHHIERLMVLGNWFLINEYDPKSVYEWFSSMYVDAYEWVMVPNVFGMSQYADGGFIATKPYISGGNYLQKMGKWWISSEEAKNSEFTKLYWDFLKKHTAKLKHNPRMSLALKQASKIN